MVCLAGVPQAPNSLISHLKEQMSKTYIYIYIQRLAWRGRLRQGSDLRITQIRIYFLQIRSSQSYGEDLFLSYLGCKLMTQRNICRQPNAWKARTLFSNKYVQRLANYLDPTNIVTIISSLNRNVVIFLHVCLNVEIIFGNIRHVPPDSTNCTFWQWGQNVDKMSTDPDVLSRI